jgi:hypothetical protein
MVLPQLQAAVVARMHQRQPSKFKPGHIHSSFGVHQDKLEHEVSHVRDTFCIAEGQQLPQPAEQGACHALPLRAGGSSAIPAASLGALSQAEEGLKNGYHSRQLLQTTGLLSSLSSLEGSMTSSLGATSVSQQAQGQEVDVIAVRTGQQSPPRVNDTNNWLLSTLSSLDFAS